MVLIALVGGCGELEEDCSNLVRGEPLEVGEVADVDVLFANGRWQNERIGDHLWSIPDVPDPPPPDGVSVVGTATRVDDDTIAVDLGEWGTYELDVSEDTIACE